MAHARLRLHHEQQATRHALHRRHHDLSRRGYEHREELVEGFTGRYGLHVLVYYETFDDIGAAIQREKNLKHWPRAWKLALIHEQNPEWDDLYLQLMNEGARLARP